MISTSDLYLNPADKFGGTWIPVEGRFLYCVVSSVLYPDSDYLEFPLKTGGSREITTSHLPSHTHTFTGIQATDDLHFRRILSDETGANIISTYSNNGFFSVSQKFGDTWPFAIDTAHNSITTDVVSLNYTPEGEISCTGSGKEFLPPYITCYAYYRIE